VQMPERIRVHAVADRILMRVVAANQSRVHRKQKKNVYIELAEAVSMRCEEKLRGRSEYPITNTDMVHSP
jgi:hypothetical protein